MFVRVENFCPQITQSNADRLFLALNLNKEGLDFSAHSATSAERTGPKDLSTDYTG